MRNEWRILEDGFPRAGAPCLRTATARDEPFLRHLFHLSKPHLADIPMPRNFVEAVIEQQYELQRASYRQQYPSSGYFLVLLQGEPIGKLTLYQDLEAASLRIVEICLKPTCCSKGFGTALLRSLQALSQKNRWSLCLSVDRQNWRAKKLYQSIGFRITGASYSHEFMVWERPLTIDIGSENQADRQGSASCCEDAECRV